MTPFSANQLSYDNRQVSMNAPDLVGDSLGHRPEYKIIHPLAAGAFGAIYVGANTETGERVAVKVESRNAERPQLAFEYDRYKRMSVYEGFPRLFYIGVLKRYTNWHGIVMELLGESLIQLFAKLPENDRRFSEPTVLQIAIQTVRRMESLHEANLIYRDVKPDNFVIGHAREGRCHDIYCLDMGLTKDLFDPVTKKHIRWEENGVAIGTMRYMSVNASLGNSQSRRDDLEAVGNMLLFFLKGRVPWMGLGGTGNEALQRIVVEKRKQAQYPAKLFHGLDPAFEAYYYAVRSLKFDEKPDYQKYVNFFEKSLYTKYPEYMRKMDWCTHD